MIHNPNLAWALACLYCCIIGAATKDVDFDFDLFAFLVIIAFAGIIIYCAISYLIL